MTAKGKADFRRRMTLRPAPGLSVDAHGASSPTSAMRERQEDPALVREEETRLRREFGAANRGRTK